MRLKPKGLNNIYTATVLAFVVGAQGGGKKNGKVGGGSIVALSSTGNPGPYGKLCWTRQLKSGDRDYGSNMRQSLLQKILG